MPTIKPRVHIDLKASESMLRICWRFSPDAAAHKAFSEIYANHKQEHKDQPNADQIITGFMAGILSNAIATGQWPGEERRMNPRQDGRGKRQPATVGNPNG